MKVNYLRLDSWTIAALMGMRSPVACSNDNNGESDGNGGGGEVVTNNGALRGNADGSEIVILAEGYDFSLDGEYIIRADSTLRIGKGVTISAKSDDAIIDYIPVEQEAKIEAIGTAFAPIIMTSDTKEPGAWGGIHICGKVLINIGSAGKPEAGDATYGGSDLTDNSGILKYVHLEYAGYKLTAEKECNGFTFYGVGNGTTLRYLETYKGTDDGFEWFGGAVSAKYLVSVSNSDDSFDWTGGWNGKDQFFIAYQKDPAILGYTCDCLTKASDYGRDMDATPISCLTPTNLTLIGANDDGGKRDIHLHTETQVKIYSALVIGKANSLTTKIEQTEEYLANGPSVLNYVVIVGDIKASGDGGYSSVLFAAAKNHNAIDQAFGFGNTFIGAQEGGANLSADGFSEKAAYKGAVEADNEWTKGQTKL